MLRHRNQQKLGSVVRFLNMNQVRFKVGKVQIRIAKIDKLKEEIDWLKIIFTILIATDISLGAWVIQNYEKTSKTLLIVSVIGVFLLTFVIVWVNQVTYRKIDELEEL